MGVAETKNLTDVHATAPETKGTMRFYDVEIRLSTNKRLSVGYIVATWQVN